MSSKNRFWLCIGIPPGWRPPDLYQPSALESQAATGLADTAVGSAAQHDARCCASVARIVDHDDTVDDDGRTRPARIAVRVGVGRKVLEVRGIEDRNVRPPSLAQQATVAQLERLG